MLKVLGSILCLPVLSLLVLSGCDDLKLPRPADSETSTTETPVEPTPAPKPAPAAPAPPPKPTAESVLAAITAKLSMLVTDQDLQKFSEVEDGLEVVTELNLVGARLTDKGLMAIAALPALTKLNLESGRIADAHWIGLSGAKNLEWLSIPKSTMNNPSMAALSTLTQLKYLNISETRVSDLGFVHLTGLTSLEELRINGLRTEGSGMEALGNKGARAPLRVIHASNTAFGALGFMHVADFDNLQELYVNNSSVTNNSLDGLKKSTTLLRVDLGRNPLLNDAGLKSLRRLRDLEFLDLNGVRQISDFTLKGFAKLKQLKELRINESACTLKGVERFKKSVPECLVRLRNKEF